MSAEFLFTGILRPSAAHSHLILILTTQGFAPELRLIYRFPVAE